MSRAARKYNQIRWRDLLLELLFFMALSCPGFPKVDYAQSQKVLQTLRIFQKMFILQIC